MIGWIVRLATPRLLSYLCVALLTLALVAGFGAWKVQRQLEAMTRDRDAQRTAAVGWAKSALGWRKSFRESEELRAREGVAARKSLAEAAGACAARVAAARKSAAAIRSIVTQEVPRDPQGCPVRGIVRADRLRDALAPGS